MKRSTLSSSFIYFLLCCIVHVVISANDDCDQTKCPGPIAYYNAVRCTPVYASEDSCCAHKYDCQHLEDRSTDKCYVNGHEYDVGERLRKEDANPCDIECVCSKGYSGVAAFDCAIVDCFTQPPREGCYLQHSHDACCSTSSEICPHDASDIPKCEVDGTTYYDGEYFTPAGATDETCICLEGYTGQNVEPWCKKPNRPYCSPEFRHASDIHYNCSPVYYSNQDPATSCSVFSRCQNNGDRIIKAETDENPSSSDDANSDLVCKFGNMTMSLGDELNMATDYSSVCVKCVSEVPPLTTCQRLSDEECDVTKHPPFHNYEQEDYKR